MKQATEHPDDHGRSIDDACTPLVSIDALRGIVARHKVRWEVWPHRHGQRNGETVQVGFDLELYGTHHHPTRRPRAGCSECLQVYSALRRLAKAILPTRNRASDYELSSFDGSLHYGKSERPEVRLSIAILHRTNFGAPVDACEQRCLHDMEQRLRMVGASKGTA